jgi:predicted Zn-dependent protease
LAGFNIKKSVALWERMRDANKGKEPPAFLSTHPSSKKRIENLSNWINQIILEYPPMER